MMVVQPSEWSPEAVNSAGTRTAHVAARQHRSHPASLLAHPGGWKPDFWAGRYDWQEENTLGSLYRWWCQFWWDLEDGEKIQALQPSRGKGLGGAAGCNIREWK